MKYLPRKVGRGSRVKSDLFSWFPMRLPWVGCSLIEMHVPIKVTYFIPRSFQVPMNSPSLRLFGPRKSNSSWPLALGLGTIPVFVPQPPSNPLTFVSLSINPFQIILIRFHLFVRNLTDMPSSIFIFWLALLQRNATVLAI